MSVLPEHINVHERPWIILADQNRWSYKILAADDAASTAVEVLNTFDDSAQKRISIALLFDYNESIIVLCQKVIIILNVVRKSNHEPQI